MGIPLPRALCILILLGALRLPVEANSTEVLEFVRKSCVGCHNASTKSGNVDLVIKEPQHPYTQLLIDSIPLPNPKLHWGQREVQPRQNLNGAGRHGCRFADRCPHVMSLCTEKAPPLYQTNDSRVVACYLFQDAPLAKEQGVTP